MTDVRPMSGLAAVPVDAILAHPDNVRRQLGDLAELADSIREVGILQPLTVERLGDGRFRILAGHRRLAAARIAGLSHVPCVMRRDQLPDESLVLMLIENCQRRNLEPFEEARAMHKLLGMVGTQQEVARRIGKSVAAVSNRLALLGLTKGEQAAVQRGDVQLGQALDVARTRRGKPQIAPSRGWHLGAQHPLAADVKTRCRHTTARRVGGQGCGECWEAAIRDDERSRIADHESAR